MTKHTKSYLFPFLLAIAVVGVVFGVILTQAQKTQQTQSKASYSVLQECQTICNDLPAAVSHLKGACSVNCTKLKNGTMKCPQFCGIFDTHAGTCEVRCNRIKNPCTPDGEICKVTGISQLKSYQPDCVIACNKVRSKIKTCDEAFTKNNAFNGMKTMQGEGGAVALNLYNLMVAKCKSTFE
ncbi:hypothetical protein A2363_03870 [Candidatus Gottesmanbacteria bacterium RIFOXYB1_FULL_47_11]|uniref:Uncharacterized protein n=1 Tax=Candidatus Gottesmanbacteria bacterium RIFOXYB1_FULL_47_11 TaxID=1798401 RepID=A0A1F6BEJ4_9BACT|nr:MAG: hypothetical protein A2363_03870 [Candidatus Gottesmanbacteria bacterium RIFOXYB1_FULL_47_11]